MDPAPKEQGEVGVKHRLGLRASLGKQKTIAGTRQQWSKMFFGSPGIDGLHYGLNLIPRIVRRSLGEFMMASGYAFAAVP